MSAIIRDVLPAVLRVLTADTAGVAAATTGGDINDTSRSAEVRIYGETLPPRPLVSGTVPLLLPPTIVVAGAGGPMLGDLAVEGYPRIEVRAYHTRGDSARALWYQTARLLSREAWFSDSLGVWFEVIDANTPVRDTEYGSGFLLARGMIALHALYH